MSITAPYPDGVTKTDSARLTLSRAASVLGKSRVVVASITISDKSSEFLTSALSRLVASSEMAVVLEGC